MIPPVAGRLANEAFIFAQMSFPEETLASMKAGDCITLLPVP
jgi:hypothetical protein